jgi:RND family efflux transporter MFP subunit
MSRNSLLKWIFLVCTPLLLAGCKKKDGLAKLPDNVGASGPQTVRTALVQVSDDKDKISATGTAAPTAMTKIMPLVPGVIIKIPLKEGDVVKKGQVLAVQDRRQFSLVLKQAQAALQGAQVGADATAREKLRFEKLMKVDALARSKYEQVLDKYRGAQAQLKMAQVALQMARKAMGDTILRAPYKGVVVKKLASRGDYATSMPPTVILVMMEIDTLELKVALPEPEMMRVKVGAAVQVYFPSLDRKLTASVTRIVRNVDPLTRSFEIVVEIPNKDLTLKPGLYARVKIDASKSRRRMLVPSDAVLDEGAGVFALFVVEGTKAKRLKVRVSAASGGKTEILDGLSGTEMVILNPSGLFDGDPIKPRKTGGAAAKPTAAAEPAPVKPKAEAVR